MRALESATFCFGSALTPAPFDFAQGRLSPVGRGSAHRLWQRCLQGFNNVAAVFMPAFDALIVGAGRFRAFANANLFACVVGTLPINFLIEP